MSSCMTSGGPHEANSQTTIELIQILSLHANFCYGLTSAMGL